MPEVFAQGVQMNYGSTMLCLKLHITKSAMSTNYLNATQEYSFTQLLSLIVYY